MVMLSKAWEPLRFHYLQSKAWRSDCRFVNLACGRGSGKTEIARRRIVRMLPIRKDWADPLYFYALPTYAQARRVAWDKILQLIPRGWIKGEPNKTEMSITTVFGSKLYVLGLDKPERIEGVQWDMGVIDESSDVKPGAFARSVVPALEHRSGVCWRIGVPKRYGAGASEFKTFFDKGDESGDNGIMSLSWPSSDILTPEQLAWAQDNLDARDFAEQYGASWEDIGGGIFHSFNDKNVTEEARYNHSRTIIVSSDFNVDPMSWVIGHRSNDQLTIFDELWIRNTNTQQTLNELHQRYGNHRNGFEFYGDASGAARKTSASVSDYLQIKNDDRFNGAHIYYPRSNPRIADRFAAVNRLACNAKGQRNLFINPRCANLIRDLKYRAYKEGSREPDDHGDVGHMSDALGYAIYRRFPIRLIPHGRPVISIGKL